MGAALKWISASQIATHMPDNTSCHPMFFRGHTYHEGNNETTFPRGHPSTQRETGLSTPGKAYMPGYYSGAHSNNTLLHLCSQWNISISLVFSLADVENKEVPNTMQATKPNFN